MITLRPPRNRRVLTVVYVAEMIPIRGWNSVQWVVNTFVLSGLISQFWEGFFSSLIKFVWEMETSQPVWSHHSEIPPPSVGYYCFSTRIQIYWHEDHFLHNVTWILDPPKKKCLVLTRKKRNGFLINRYVSKIYWMLMILYSQYDWGIMGCELSYN